MYMQQCMLGSSVYRVPIARRSDGEAIATRCYLQNWVTYPLPKPWPRVGPQFQKTCFKPLGLFLISTSLQCIQAFNHGADPWNLVGHKEEASTVSVTYDNVAVKRATSEKGDKYDAAQQEIKDLQVTLKRKQTLHN
jgi:hypothetical protein